MKKFLLFIVISIIILVYTTSLTAQNPQFYNGNTVSGSNSLVDSKIVNFGVNVSDAVTTLCSAYDTVWAPSNTYPSLPEATCFNSSAWIGDDLYVQAPNSSGAAATDIFKYTLGGSWTIGVPCLTAVTGASMTACGGKLYLIGGGTSSVTVGSTNVQQFDPGTNTWTAKAPLPVALSTHGSVCWGDSVIFVVGGPYSVSGSNLNVYFYRPANDSWGTITNSLPSGQGRRTFALGITNDNKIVMSCGFNTTFLKTTFIGTIGANATQITWTQAANAPVALSRCAGAGYDNTFFLVGGDTNNTDVKNTKVFLLDVNGNIWDKVILNNPNPVSNICNAVTASCFNDTVRVFQPGGNNGFIGIDNFNITGHGNIFVGINPSTGNNTEKNILGQNFPNPFCNSTTINYQLNSNTYVILKIYDIMGKEVKTLVTAHQTAGSYNVNLDASNLTAGIYVYQLTTNELSISKRMIIEK